MHPNLVVNKHIHRKDFWLSLHLLQEQAPAVEDMAPQDTQDMEIR